MRKIWGWYRSKSGRVQFGIAVGLVVFVGLVTPNGEPTPEPKQAVAESSPSPTPSEAAEPEPVLEPEPTGAKATLAAVADDVFDGDTNYDKPKLKQTQTDFTKSGKGWTAFVTFRGDDNLTTGMRKGGIEQDMIEAYRAFYATDVRLKEVILDAEFPLVDTYGNESDASVYVTYLPARVADKINWSEADYLEWSNLWTTTVLHPEFR